MQEVEPELTLMDEIGSQIKEFQYPNPMDIRNLIDYPTKQEVGYISTEEDIIGDLLKTSDDNPALKDTSEEVDVSIEKPMIKR